MSRVGLRESAGGGLMSDDQGSCRDCQYGDDPGLLDMTEYGPMRPLRAAAKASQIVKRSEASPVTASQDA